jgi:hypothetical protein
VFALSPPKQKTHTTHTRHTGLSYVEWKVRKR